MDWLYDGSKRPDFAIDPLAGQESVWDYKRPPVIRREIRHVRVIANGITVAESMDALRVLETASPPGIYIPPEDVHFEYLIASASSTYCEWKGRASYWSLKLGDVWIRNAAWSYPFPFEEFKKIGNYMSFYPAMLECWLGGERVKPQPGTFYGGWITHDIVGPFKGAPGTESW